MSVHPFELTGSGEAPIRGDVWLPEHVPHVKSSGLPSGTPKRGLPKPGSRV